jgi:ribosomal protein L11 methyltransferase
MDQWIEVRLDVDGEAAEAIAEVLQRFSYQGIAIEQPELPADRYDEGMVPPPERLILKAYLPTDDALEATRARLESALGHMAMLYPMPQPVYTPVSATDWSEAWKAHYHPVRIGRRLLVKPRWIDLVPQPDDLVLSLDPGMAFGTGTHPTTQLCLEALEDQVTPGMSVLDLGCGSGILAIAAAKLGASTVLAIDNDPIAVTTARENAQSNGVSGTITIAEGSLADLLAAEQSFDLIVVNILAPVIIAMAHTGLAQTVLPGGRAIFSGIIEEQAADVAGALRAAGLTPIQQRQMGDWVAIEAQRD